MPQRSNVLLAMSVVLAGWAGGVLAGTYSGGTGEPNNPYRISTAGDLIEIGAHPNDWDKHFILTDDVDLSNCGGQLEPIGVFIEQGDPNNKPFTGAFEGNGHTISHFTVGSAGENSVGLFGYVDGSGAEIGNLRLLNGQVEAKDEVYAGLLVGLLNGTVSGCAVEGGSVSGTGDYAGGLAGYNDYGSVISNSYAGCSVSGDYQIGGLVGCNNYGGVISNCHAAGSVAGTGHSVGGLVANSLGTISDSSATGDVSGDHFYAGGLVGTNRGGTIANSYASGDVSGNHYYVGGLAARNGGSISASYASGSVWASGYYVGGLVGRNDAHIFNSYAGGSVRGTADYVGGLVGYNDGGVLAYCYAAGKVSGTAQICSGALVGYDYAGSNNYSGCFWNSTINPSLTGVGSMSDPPEVIGQSTVNMQMAGTFIISGWDFVGETANGPDDIWDICERTNYPKLAWQIPEGDLLCPDGVNFIDFSYFAERWMYKACGEPNNCDGTDLDRSGSVDTNDLEILIENWLSGVR